jgi:hypothetical protein
MESVMGKPFDSTKPVRTRDGRAARIVCTDAGGMQPLVALVSLAEREIIERYHKNGLYYENGRHESGLDLVNIPVKRGGWVNVLPPDRICRDVVGMYDTKEAADKNASENRVACIFVEFEEGEGL